MMKAEGRGDTRASLLTLSFNLPCSIFDILTLPTSDLRFRGKRGETFVETRESPCRFEEAETHCIIELKPELNKAPWGDIDSIGTSLVDRMRAYADGKGKKSAAFLVDLSPLNYMGSATVALVVRLWKLVKEKNGKMVVVNEDPTVLEVLRLSGLEDVWTIVDSPEEGFKALGLVLKKPAVAPETVSTETPPSPPSYGSVVEAPKGAAAWALAAIVLLVAAAAGLFFFSFESSPVSDTRISLGLLFGGGVLGLIPATVAACLGIGIQRTVGITSVVGCLALLVAGFVVHPDWDALLARKTSPSNAETPSPSNGNSRQAKSNQPTSIVPPPKPEPAGHAEGAKTVAPKVPKGNAAGASVLAPPIP
jgi:anti-anti-sigma factor